MGQDEVIKVVGAIIGVTLIIALVIFVVTQSKNSEGTQINTANENFKTATNKISDLSDWKESSKTSP